MTQTLYVKTTGKDGKSALKPVHVIRSWQESSGAQLYLHTNGIYGYKDGSPVRKVEEFDIIGDKIQKKGAIAWWERKGKDLSAKYYKDQEKRLMKELQSDIRIIEGDKSDLDIVQYVRRLVTDRRKNAWSEPQTWFEWFTTRPDWWGHADLIEIAGYRYKTIDQEEIEEVQDEEQGPAEEVSYEDQEPVESLQTVSETGGPKEIKMVPAGELEAEQAEKSF